MHTHSCTHAHIHTHTLMRTHIVQGSVHSVHQVEVEEQEHNHDLHSAIPLLAWKPQLQQPRQ